MDALGCKSFLSRPVDLAGFTDTIRRLFSYWLDIVILPGAATESAAPH